MEKVSPYYFYYQKGLILTGRNNLSSVKEGIKYLETALTLNNKEEVYFALFHAYNKIGDMDAQERNLLKAANNRFISSYNDLGVFYAYVEGKQNKEKALMWFQRSIEAKDPKSYFNLSNYFIEGTSIIDQDIDAAIKLLNEALKLNDPKWNGSYHYLLGRAYLVKKEYINAFNFFHQAIKEDYTKAHFELAHIYKEGLGVPQNNDMYLDHLQDYLDVDSAVEMGGVFISNQIIKSDEDIAASYFKYAADRGNPIGAIMYAGILVGQKQKNTRAINYYLELAFKNSVDDEHFKSNLDGIEKTLDESVRSKIDELASKYWGIEKGKA